MDEDLRSGCLQMKREDEIQANPCEEEKKKDISWVVSHVKFWRKDAVEMLKYAVLHCFVSQVTEVDDIVCLAISEVRHKMAGDWSLLGYSVEPLVHLQR
jgi:hypothetical protein